MKRVSLLLCLLFSVALTAQNNKPTDSEIIDLQFAEDVHVLVDKMPEYPGGKKAMFAYITKNMKFPDSAREKNISGVVVVNCVINEEGEITNIRLRRKVNPQLDREAMRLIKAMPNWEPGRKQGKLVKVSVDIPVKFKI